MHQISIFRRKNFKIAQLLEIAKLLGLGGDFTLWVVFQENPVYADKPQTIEALKGKMVVTIRVITSEICRNVVENCQNA